MKLKYLNLPPVWLALVAVLLVSGCATNQINWKARLGSYTYDQAVTELGPPEKSAKLTDGTVVADWLTQRGQTIVTTTGGGFDPRGPVWGNAAGPGTVTTINTPAYFLRLTFDSAGRLQSWTTYAR